MNHFVLRPHIGILYQMRLKHWQDKPKYAEENLLPYRSVRHKSHRVYPRSEPGLRLCSAPLGGYSPAISGLRGLTALTFRCASGSSLDGLLFVTSFGVHQYFHGLSHFISCKLKVNLFPCLNKSHASNIYGFAEV